MPFEKLWRGQEDQRKPRTSELFVSETLKQFNREWVKKQIMNLNRERAARAGPVLVAVAMCPHYSPPPRLVAADKTISKTSEIGNGVNPHKLVSWQ